MSDTPPHNPSTPPPPPPSDSGAAVSPSPTQAPATQAEYYRQRLDELSGQAIRADALISRTTRELRQRRQGFAVLSELHRVVRTDMPTAEIDRRVLEAIQQSLKMDRAALLAVEAGAGVPTCAIGFELPANRTSLALDSAMLSEGSAVIASKAAPATESIRGIRDSLGIALFVAVPVVSQGRTEAVLIAGRQREMKPFFPPLDEQDAFTLQSLAGFLGSARANASLFHEQKRMTDAFARFVPRQFLEFLGRGKVADIELGDQTQQVMSVLFSDIRAFTTMSERMTPKQTFDFINRYLEFVAPAVIENGGFIDKYIGDAIMALFPGTADGAVRAAIGLHRGVARFNAELVARGSTPVAIGAGLHTGTLMLGTIGFRERMDTTVIADAVNLASRMEGLTKQYGAGVLISGATRDAMTSAAGLGMRTIDRVMVKGKSDPVEIVEVFDADEPALRDAKSASLPAFASALEAYTRAGFADAASQFEAILSTCPRDGAATLLLERCRRLAASPPQSWSGVVPMEK